MSKENEIQMPRKRANSKTNNLTAAIIEGEDDKANSISKEAIDSKVPPVAVLKACYAGAKVVEKLYAQRKIEKADLMLSLEAYLAAIKPLKEHLKNLVKLGIVVLGAMESDGEWAATAYTLPLLKEFGHTVHLVASFRSDWYIDEIRKYEPDVVCLTCVRASAKTHIEGIIEALKQTPSFLVKNKSLYDTNMIIGCGTYLTKRESASIGCHKYASGYMQAAQVINEIINER